MKHFKLNLLPLAAALLLGACAATVEFETDGGQVLGQDIPPFKVGASGSIGGGGSGGTTNPPTVDEVDIVEEGMDQLASLQREFKDDPEMLALINDTIKQGEELKAEGDQNA